MTQARRNRLAIAIAVLGSAVAARGWAYGEVWSEALGGAAADGASAAVPVWDGGTLLVGHTRSFGAGGDDALVVRLAPSGAVLWAKTYGGPGDDAASAVTRTNAGYLVVGRTQSFGAAGKDLWLLRIDDGGGIVWQERIGGPLDDEGNAVSLLGAGTGYLVAGSTTTAATGTDVWVLQVSEFGAIVWQKRYGGANVDQAFSIRPTGAGIVVAGETRSFVPGFSAPWLLDLDSTGGLTWQKTYDAFGSGVARSVLGTSDGGLIVAGEVLTNSFSGADGWVAKLSSLGAVVWESRYSTLSVDELKGIWPTLDHNYVIAGAIKTSPFVPSDAWMAKIGGGDGSLIWQNTYGGGSLDRFASLSPAAAGQEFVLAGDTGSFGAGGTDALAVQVDENGHVTCGCSVVAPGTASLATVTSAVTSTTATAVTTTAAKVNTTAIASAAFPALATQCSGTQRTGWSKAIGTPGAEYLWALDSSGDGGTFVVGTTQATAGGPGDLWVARLDASGSVLWQKAYGDAADEQANAVMATDDGGCIVAGYAPSFRAGGKDGWLLKLAADGSVDWQRQYGMSFNDTFVSVAPNQYDPGYLVAGSMDMDGTDSKHDVWVLAVNLSGDVNWEYRYGYKGDDVAASMAYTSDGAIIAANSTTFTPGFLEPLVIKIDPWGAIEWMNTYEYSGGDALTSIVPIENGYIASGEVLAFAYYGPDAWLVQLDLAGNVVWNKAYGDSVINPFDVDHNDGASSVQPTGDGYIAGGYTHTVIAFNDLAWLFKVDSTGNVLWEKAYGSGPLESASAITGTPEGGYLAAGYTSSAGAGSLDGLLLKVDADGRFGCTCDGIVSSANVWEPPTTWRPTPQSYTQGSVVSPTAATVTIMGTDAVICPPQ